MILDEIVAFKKKQLEEQKLQLKPELMAILAKNYIRRTISFKRALKQQGMGIIGEVKKASPSKGIIKEDFNPIEIAKIYEASGAHALSVLTETEFFRGSIEYLKAIREVVELPILRKDFIIDPYQIDEAYLNGADAILLIVKILDDESLKTLMIHAKRYGLDVLVETHNQDEIERALQVGADMIGINNRDLNTFETTLETTKKLIPHVPKECMIISESGIQTVEDMESIKGMGAHGVLIGEAFMRTDNLKQMLEDFKGV